MVYWLNSRNVDRSMVIFSLSFYYQCLAIRPRFVSKLVIYIESKLPLVFSWYFQNRVKSLPLGKKKKTIFQLVPLAGCCSLKLILCQTLWEILEDGMGVLDVLI